MECGKISDDFIKQVFMVCKKIWDFEIQNMKKYKTTTELSKTKIIVNTEC